MKGAVIWILAGALAGIVAASFIVPPMLSWYNEAGFLSQGGQAAAMVNPRSSATRRAGSSADRRSEPSSERPFSSR